MIFEKVPRGSGKFNSFHGKRQILSARAGVSASKQGTRYRLTFHNRNDDAHPLHVHRHQLEIAEIYGKPTSGVIKDTVVVPTYGRASGGLHCRPAGSDVVPLPHPASTWTTAFKALMR